MIAEFLTLERKRATIICIDKILPVGYEADIFVPFTCLVMK
jgi:hypothetical protein